MSSEMKPRIPGAAFVLAASLCFSTGGVLMKFVPWNPLAINGVRNAIACLVIGLYILATRHRLKFNLTVLIGAVSMAGVTTLFSIANKLTTAGNTIILQYTAPIWIVILMFFIFGKKPDRTALVSIGIVFAGIIFFFLDSLSTGRWLGDFCALLSGIFYAGVFMLNSFEKGDALSSVFFGQLFCLHLLHHGHEVHGPGHGLDHQRARADPEPDPRGGLLRGDARNLLAHRSGHRHPGDPLLQHQKHTVQGIKKSLQTSVLQGFSF